MPFLGCSISKLATGEISIFKLVSEVKETALSLTLSETPKQALSHPGRYVFHCTFTSILEDVSFHYIKARIFLIVDLQEFFFRFRVKGRKKSSENDQLIGHFQRVFF